METVPQKVSTRFSKTVKKFQRILNDAAQRDINESDTVKIVTDILAEVLGYAEYSEITTAYAIRNTYCDLAVQIGGQPKFLVEVVAINRDLMREDLEPVRLYAAKQGIEWVVHTNGRIWQVFRLITEKTIVLEKILELDFQHLNTRRKKDRELLFILTKEGFSENYIYHYLERKKNINEYVIAAILLQEHCLKRLRRELEKLTGGITVEVEELENLLRSKVLQSNVLEGTEARNARALVNRPDPST